MILSFTSDMLNRERKFRRRVFRFIRSLRRIPRKWRLLGAIQQIRAARAFQTAVIQEQSRILWVAARSFSSEQRDMSSRDLLRVVAGKLAESRALASVRDEREARIAMVSVCFAAALAMLWVTIPVFPHVIDFITHFDGHSIPWGLVGWFICISSTLIPLLIPILYIKLSESFRYLSMYGTLVLTGIAFVAAAAITPGLAIYLGWVTPPGLALVRSLVDGIFIGGLLDCLVLVAFGISAFVSEVRDDGEIWMNPRLILIREFVSALNRILPKPSQNPEPIRWVAENILQERKDIDSSALEKVKDALDGECYVKRPELKERWTGIARKSDCSDPILAGFSKFMIHLHTAEGDHAWGEPVHMTSITEDLRAAARCVEALASRHRTGDEARDRWLRQVCASRAAYILELQRGVVLPRNDTRDYLQGELCHLLSLALTNDWGNMPTLSLSGAESLRWWRRGVAATRALVVAILPLSGVFVLRVAVGKELNPTLNASLWTAALAWFAVSVLVLLDDRFSEKLSRAKELMGVLKAGKEKD